MWRSCCAGTHDARIILPLLPLLPARDQSLQFRPSLTVPSLNRLLVGPNVTYLKMDGLGPADEIVAEVRAPDTTGSGVSLLWMFGTCGPRRLRAALIGSGQPGYGGSLTCRLLGDGL